MTLCHLVPFGDIQHAFEIFQVSGTTMRRRASGLWAHLVLWPALLVSTTLVLPASHSAALRGASGPTKAPRTPDGRDEGWSWTENLWAQLVGTPNGPSVLRLEDWEWSTMEWRQTEVDGAERERERKRGRCQELILTNYTCMTSWWNFHWSRRVPCSGCPMFETSWWPHPLTCAFLYRYF